jgi:hypothetical protein
MHLWATAFILSMTGSVFTALPASATCNTRFKPTCSPCETLVCIAGDNAWDCQPKAAGTACNDGDACTVSDVCDEARSRPRLKSG